MIRNDYIKEWKFIFDPGTSLNEAKFTCIDDDDYMYVLHGTFAIEMYNYLKQIKTNLRKEQ